MNTLKTGIKAPEKPVHIIFTEKDFLCAIMWAVNQETCLSDENGGN